VHDRRVGAGGGSSTWPAYFFNDRGFKMARCLLAVQHRMAASSAAKRARSNRRHPAVSGPSPWRSPRCAGREEIGFSRFELGEARRLQ
jgi:hypothetical protein